MININPLDLKIHINGMKENAKALKQEAKDKLVRAEAIEKEACALENSFVNELSSVVKSGAIRS